MEIIDVEELREKIEKNLEKNIRVTFKTPALFSSKLLLPPSLKEKYKKVNVCFFTLPSIGSIVAHAYNLYCNVIGKRRLRIMRLSLEL